MKKTFVFGAALSAMLLSGAFAQTSPPAPAGQGSAGANFVMSQKPDQWLASNFRGTDVLGSDNAKIGSVSDILFDKSGKIQAYVVSIGGFLGMGSKDVAIAPTSFDVVPGSNGSADKLKLSMTKDQVQEAQNFQPYERPRPATTGAAPGGSPMGGSRPGGSMR
jgi:sporulation protein YlmC with PRC-barrel domain